MFLKTLLLMTYIVTKTTGFSLTDYGVGSRRLLGAGFVTETVKNLLQCRSLCQRNSLCRSLNYNPKTRECTENFKDATTSGATLDSTVRDVIYEEKQSFPKVGSNCYVCLFIFVFICLFVCLFVLWLIYLFIYYFLFFYCKLEELFSSIFICFHKRRN